MAPDMGARASRLDPHRPRQPQPTRQGRRVTLSHLMGRGACFVQYEVTELRRRAQGESQTRGACSVRYGGTELRRGARLPSLEFVPTFRVVLRIVVVPWKTRAGQTPGQRCPSLRGVSQTHSSQSRTPDDPISTPRIQCAHGRAGRRAGSTGSLPAGGLVWHETRDSHRRRRQRRR